MRPQGRGSQLGILADVPNGRISSTPRGPHLPKTLRSHPADARKLREPRQQKETPPHLLRQVAQVVRKRPRECQLLLPGLDRHAHRSALPCQRQNGLRFRMDDPLFKITGKPRLCPSIRQGSEHQPRRRPFAPAILSLPRGLRFASVSATASLTRSSWRSAIPPVACIPQIIAHDLRQMI